MKIYVRTNETFLFKTLTPTAVATGLAFWLGLLPACSFAALENSSLLENQPILEASIPLPFPVTSEPHEVGGSEADRHEDPYSALTADDARLSPLPVDLSLSAFQRYPNIQPKAADSGTQPPLPVVQEAPFTDGNDSLTTIPNAVLLCISVVIGLVAVARRNSF